MNNQNKNECSFESCDMFDFMSDYVGRTILHPGGVKATQKLLESLKINKNTKVLEIACGKGLTSIYLAKKYDCQVVGIDILEKSIEKARFAAKSKGVSHLVSFHQGDAQKLQFSDNEFDIILAQAVLVLVQHKSKVIREATRVLKPGGLLGWIEFSWKKQPTNDFISTATKEICGVCIANTKTYDGWEELFKREGIRDLQIEKHNMELRGMLEMVAEEGWVNGLKIVYRLLTNIQIRTRMMKLATFFKSYPEYVGYGIFTGSK